LEAELNINRGFPLNCDNGKFFPSISVKVKSYAELEISPELLLFRLKKLNNSITIVIRKSLFFKILIFKNIVEFI
jgi:hypothetical protein